MNEGSDALAAFGSIEEGDSPLKPYIDPTLFDKVDKKAQIDLLTPAFDAMTLAGADFDIKVQDSATGKRYTLLKGEEVIKILEMDSTFTNDVLDAIKNNQEDD